MRFRALVPLLACTVCFAGPPRSAQDILTAARNALGLKKGAVHALTIAASSDRGSQSSDVTMTLEMPDKYLRETRAVSFGGLSDPNSRTPAPGAFFVPPTTVQCVDGDDIWSGVRVAPGADEPQKPAPLDDSRKRNLSFQFSRYLLVFLLDTRPDFPVDFEYLGQTPSPTGMADVVEGKGPEEFLVRLFFDTRTHRPLMLAYTSPSGLVQLWLDKYRADGGFLLPHRLTTMVNGDTTEVFTVKKVKINPPVSEEKFKAF